VAGLFFVVSRPLGCQGWCDDRTFATQYFYSAFKSKTTNTSLIAEYNVCWCLPGDSGDHPLDVTSSVLDDKPDNLLVTRVM